MKRRIKVKNVIIAIIILLIIIFNIVFGIYIFNMAAVDKKNVIQKEIEIKSGMTVDSILALLKEEKLIKSELFSKIYIKLGKHNLQAGTYELNGSMSSFDIIKNIASGKITTKYNISITFREGLNVRKYAKEIEAKTNNKYEDIMRVFEDENFAKEMIKEYWFLDESILKTDIYYPLEGYLFPDTYTFINKDVDVKTIIRTLLNEFNNKITPYKEKIENSEFTLNELVIHASIAEVESLPGSDRRGVVGVNMNRIRQNISLGSDMTAYYAYKIDDFKTQGGLTLEQFLDCTSPYNTRCLNNTGLPIGPISNPGIDALIGAIEYTKSDYIYYVADCNGKTYFAKYDYEINNIIRDLMNKELWCEVSS